MLKPQIQEKVAQNDLNEGLLCLLKSCQSIKTDIKAYIFEFQGKSELESEIDQIEHEDIEEDQFAGNLTTKLILEENANKGSAIELENKLLIPVLS